MDTQRTNWTLATKLVIIVIALAGIVYALFRFSGVITPIIIAIITAFILTSPVNWLQKRLHIPHWAAILIVYLVLFAIFTVILVLFVPAVVRQTRHFNIRTTALFRNAQILLQEGGSITIGNIPISLEDVVGQMSSSFQTFFEPLVGTTLDIVRGVLSSVAWVVFIIVTSIYLIKDSAQIITWMEKLPPPSERADFIRLKSEINTIWSAFFRGQILLSLIVASIITIETMILGLPFPLFLGILAGLLEFFPGIGHTIWFVIASLVALLAGSTWLHIPNLVLWLILVGCQVVFTQFDLNYLIPRIIGRSVSLSPLVVILGILAGASLAGVLGIVLAAPTIASLRVLTRYFYARILDLDPFPVKETPERLPAPRLAWWKKQSGPPQRFSNLKPFQQERQANDSDIVEDPTGGEDEPRLQKG